MLPNLKHIVRKTTRIKRLRIYLDDACGELCSIADQYKVDLEHDLAPVIEQKLPHDALERFKLLQWISDRFEELLEAEPRPA